MEQSGNQDVGGRFSETKAARIASLTALAVVLVYSLSVFVGILRSRPRFLSMFVEMGVQHLPLTTTLVMMPFYPWILPVLGAAGVAKEFLLKDSHATLLINGIHLLVVMILAGLYREGLFTPLLHIIEQLGQ